MSTSLHDQSKWSALSPNQIGRGAARRQNAEPASPRTLNDSFLAAHFGQPDFRSGSGVPVHREPNRSFDSRPTSRIAEHPVSMVKRSYERLAVERPLTVGAVVQPICRD